jgi:hypothetical protein
MVPVALAFIVCMALFLTIRTLYFSKTQDVPPVRLPDVSFSPCGLGEQDTDLQIRSNPFAMYKSEAKRRGITGTVRLAVYFDFDGKVSIAGVMSRLPYGLTEEAIKSAKQITFIPGRSCGHLGSERTEPGEIDYEFPSGQGRVVQL